MKTKIKMLAVCLLSLVVVVSCTRTDHFTQEKDNATTLSQSQRLAPDSVQMMSMSSVTYSVTPSVGNFTPNSSSSIVLPGAGACGSFNGGMIKAKVVSQSGSSFTVEIYPQIGTSFGGSGTAYIKATSVCGTIANSATYTSLHTKVSITINATFTQGVTHFYPVIITSTGGRYYAEPFMVYTLPSYTMSYTNGATMGTVDGVEVRSSGSNNQNLGSVNQCTRFCERYYDSVYAALPFSGWGDATDWMANYDDTKFEKQVQGSINPRVGDILCFGGGTTTPSKPGGYGHVAIITEVSPSEVKFAHQNGGTGGYLDAFIPIGGRVSRSGGSLYMISPTTTLYVKGIIRKKP